MTAVGVSEHAKQPGSAGPERARSLRRLAIEGSAISLIAYGASQVLRIGAHAAMAQELLPEVFGLMGIVNAVILGVQMFSDLGIGPSIIRGTRGDDPVFLRTAWTVQIVRGLVVWAAISLLAVPLALGYSASSEANRALLWLLPVMGLTAVASGFNSTALFTLNRKLLLARLAALDLASQAIGIGVTLAWVFIDPSIWAFVAGGLVGAIARCALSHATLPGIRHALAWDRPSVRELVRFGGWIFVSTAMGFFADKGYMLVLAAFMATDRLGLMSAAAMLASAVDEAMSKVWQSVLFPAYARLKEKGADHLRRRVALVRLWLMAATFAPLMVLAFFGPRLASLLYWKRDAYADVGAILVVLACGRLVTPRTSAFPVLLAMGDSFRFMVLKFATVAAMLAGMLAGGLVGGEVGMVYGLAFSPVLAYPAHAWALRAHRMNMFGLDLLGLVIGGGASAAAIALLGERSVW